MFRRGYERGLAEGRKVRRVSSEHETAVLGIGQTPLSIQDFLADQLSDKLAEASRITPRKLEFEADVKAPVMIAATGGALVGAVVLISGVGAAYLLSGGVRWYVGSLWLAALSMAVYTFAQWKGGEALRHAALMTIETITGQDIDGDGIVGKAKNAPIGKTFLKLPNGTRIIEEVPITYAQAKIMYSKLKSNGWSFSRRKMKGVLSQSEASRMGELFIRHGMKKDDLLNESGRDYVAALAGLNDE